LVAGLIVAAAGRTQILVVSHAQILIEELAASALCRRLHLVKDFGETKLEGETLLNRTKWAWPSR
jgi:predicted ATPase